MQDYKFKIGDRVIYRNLVANVDGVTKSFSGDPMLNLTALDDEELTCTALAKDCELYAEAIYDPELAAETLIEAKLESKRIQSMVGGLTDKYFRDGNH